MSVVIYIIVFSKNPEKYYVGSALDFYERSKNHKSDLKNNKHHCNQLQNFYNKHKKSSFKFYILEYIKDLSQILNREDYYLQDYFDFDDELYNECFVANSSLFYKHSKENIKKMSISHIGQVPWNKGKRTGTQSKEVIMKRTGKNNPRYGVPRSKKEKQKIKEGQISKPFVIGKIKYDFLSDAAQDFNITKEGIRKRLHSKYFSEYHYE